MSGARNLVGGMVGVLPGAGSEAENVSSGGSVKSLVYCMALGE